MLSIRTATVDDSAAISALLDSLGYPDSGPFLTARITHLLAHPDAELLVATAEGQLALLGVISLHFIAQLALAGDFCRISYFCVAPQARGQGVGAQLEAYAVKLAQQRGCDRIELHCAARRLDAHRFYQRQGYQESPKYLLKPL